MAVESGSLTTLIAGLGGQGVVMAGGVLAQAALLAGLDVRQSEMHGLSQRFGSVSCQIRIGTGLYSPHRGHGAVDLLVSLEGYEAFKQLPFLRPDGNAIVNRLWRKPVAAVPSASIKTVDSTKAEDVSDPRMEWFPGTELTQQANCPRSLNFFMLGVLSTRLIIDEAYWYEAIDQLASKKGSKANLEIFLMGRSIAVGSDARPARRRPLAMHALDEAKSTVGLHSDSGSLR